MVVLAGCVLALLAGAVVYFISPDEGRHETVAGTDAKARETAEGIADVPIALPMAGDAKVPERKGEPPEARPSEPSVPEPPEARPSEPSEPETFVPEPSVKEGEAETEMPVRLAEESPSGRMLPEERTYTVGRGDTLWYITERFRGEPFLYNEVARDNKIRNPDLIYPGQKVKIVVEDAANGSEDKQAHSE